MEKAPETRWSMQGCKGRFFVRGKKQIIWYKSGRSLTISTELQYSRLNRKLAADKIMLLENPAIVQRNNVPQTVNEAFEQFLKNTSNQKAQSTIKAYIYAYKFTFPTNCKLEINPVQKMIENAINKNLMAQTRKTHILRMKSFFEYCFRQKWISENPINANHSIKVPDKIIEIWYPEEMQRIFDYWHDKDKIFYLYLQTVFKCALRRSEAKNLTWNQVWSDNKYRENIVFEKSKFGNTFDLFPLSAAIQTIFNQLPESPRTGKIFYYNDEHSLSRRLTRSMKRLDIPKTHYEQKGGNGRCLHTFRKTRISEWLFKDNLSPQVVSKLSRDDITTIMKYYAYQNSTDLQKFVV